MIIKKEEVEKADEKNTKASSLVGEAPEKALITKRKQLALSDLLVNSNAGNETRISTSSG